MPKIDRPVSISVPNTYGQPMASPQAEERKLSATSARRSTNSGRRTPSELQHLDVATTAPPRKTAFDHRDCIVIFLSKLYDRKKHCFVEFQTRLRCFINGKKSSLLSDSAVCYLTFQSRPNRDVQRTEKRVTHNQKRNVLTNDWPIIFQLQD